MKPRTTLEEVTSEAVINLMRLLGEALTERDTALDTIKNLLSGDWTPEQYHNTIAKMFQSEMVSQRLKGYQDGVVQGKLGLPDWVNQMAEDTYIRKLKHEVLPR